MQRSCSPCWQAPQKKENSWLAVAVDTVTLPFSAAGVFGQLKDAFNTVWNIIILLLGAEFTQVRACIAGQRIRPKSYAQSIRSDSRRG